MTKPTSPLPALPCIWNLPDPSIAPPNIEMLAIGADLAPETLLHSYRKGLFPMPADQSFTQKILARNKIQVTDPPIAWWSPNPRGILPLDALRITRSLRQSIRKYDVRFNTSFKTVVIACANIQRPGAWITPAIIRAYETLHNQGWAHSVETWDTETNTLVGGLYGIAIGGFFAGESMFHTQRDASKVALVALVKHMQQRDAQLLDIQWATDHLASLGATSIERNTYLQRLEHAIHLPTQLFLSQ